MLGVRMAVFFGIGCLHLAYDKVKENGLKYAIKKDAKYFASLTL